ncbi:MAG: efflux RND transporter periplasmic adaptor subunit [Thermodesulfobacteriota bacterium]
MLLLIFIISQAVTSNSREEEIQLATVAFADFDIKVNTIGTLDADRSFMISSSVKGDKGKIIYLIDDGRMVKAGDVLLRFDPTPFEDEILRLSGELRSRDATLEAVMQNLEWEKSQAEGAVHTAEFNLRDARQEYERYRGYIKDLEDLGKKGHDYPTEIFQAKKKAEQLLSKLQKAEVDLSQVAQERTFKVAGAIASAKKAQSEKETTQLTLGEARDQLRRTEVRAPFAGIVVHYEIFRDGQKRKPRIGDTVWQNQPLLYLPDISAMVVKTQVRELDLYKIKSGQRASIRVDAFPDSVYTGAVTTIGALGVERTERSRGEKYFQLSVAMKGSDSRLRPGMTARVFILADSVKKVLCVPIHAVFDENGQKHCFVSQGKRFKKVNVVLGKNNEDLVEILSGLKVAERVALVKPSAESVIQ